MSLHYLLTLLPGLPEKVVLGEKFTEDTRTVLTTVLELAPAEASYTIDKLALYEDLKNILAVFW